MLRVSKDLPDLARLDYSAGVHHRDAIRCVGDHAKVVRDQDRRRVLLFGQAFDQAEDLGLDCDVQGGGRFVGDQYLRTTCDRQGDHRSLAHAAGELVRVGLRACRRPRDADFDQELLNAFGRLRPGKTGVEKQHLGDLRRRYAAVGSATSVDLERPSRVPLPGCGVTRIRSRRGDSGLGRQPRLPSWPQAGG